MRKESLVVELSVLLSKYVYYEDNESQDGKEAIFDSIKKISPNIKEFCSTKQLDDDIKANYYTAQVWLDEDYNTWFFVNVGTRFNVRSLDIWISDILDDLNIMKGILPNKAKSVIELNEHIFWKLAKDEYSKWSFVYTGHSLGGHLASIGASDMYLRVPDARSIKSISFDGPGARKSIDIIYKDKKLTPKDTDVKYISIRNINDIVSLPEDEVETCLIYRVDLETPIWYSKLKEIAQEIIPRNCVGYFVNLFKCFGNRCFTSIYSYYEKENLKKFINIEYDTLKTKFGLFSKYKDFLELLSDDDEIEVNHVATRLGELLDGEVHIRYDGKFINSYIEKEKIFKYARAYDLAIAGSVIVEDLNHEILSSQIVCSMDLKERIEGFVYKDYSIRNSLSPTILKKDPEYKEIAIIDLEGSNYDMENDVNLNGSNVYMVMAYI